MEKAPIFRHLRRKTGGNQKRQSWVKSGFKLACELFFEEMSCFREKGFKMKQRSLKKRYVDKFEKSTFWRVLEPQFLRTGSIIKEDFEVTTQILPEIRNKSVFEDWLQKYFTKIRFHTCIYIYIHSIYILNIYYIQSRCGFFPCFFLNEKNELTIKLSKCRSPMPKM